VSAKHYVRGSRGPGRPAKYRYSRLGEGVILSRVDPAAHVGTPLADWDEPRLAAHFASHLGLANATGAATGNGLTAGNNPVRLADGRVVWVGADQIDR
jgi:hypothetical protein